MLSKLVNFRAWSIGARLTLVTFTIVSGVLLSLMALIDYTSTARAERTATHDVTEKTKMVVEMLDTFDNDLRSEIAVLAKVLLSDVPGAMSIDASKTVDVAGLATPSLQAGGEELNLNFALADRFTRQTGGVATIFVKQGEDFIRVTTSVKKENGERAIGTKLDHQHPGYEKIISGNSYVGNAMLFGKQYMTQYDPIKDSAGNVIGILFVGINFTESAQKILAKVRAMTIGESGYFYALDARQGKDLGNLVLHPLKEGQNILASKDADGHEFIKEILERKQGVIHYAWINAERGESLSREKVVAFFPMKNWNWVVAGGIYVDEYTRESSALIHLYQSIALMLMLVMGALLYWTMRQRLSIPLRLATDAAKQLASGDLTVCVKVTRVDEIGQLMLAINGIGQGLAAVVQDVRDSTTLIARSAQEIAHGNADLSARTESQASSLQQTAASMHELTGTVRQNSENADQANALVVSAAGVAARGRQMVVQVSATMTSIKESSHKIVDIISVIDGIAFQTNILALNAAVEAARAGEQGRGFAVVATEVRNLAQRSAAAAKEIAALIGDSVAKVDAGNLLAGTMGKTMDDIVGSVTNVTHIMAEISAAGRAQSSGIAQVNQAVEQMDQMTQQNAALVEQAAAAAQLMEDQSGTLVKAVGAFKVV
ncbi:methyl-accepting chemotaxis protein [Oxalobacteraceae bacterium GrIS 1.11]